MFSLKIDAHIQSKHVIVLELSKSPHSLSVTITNMYEEADENGQDAIVDSPWLAFAP